MSQFIEYGSSGVYIVDPDPSGVAGQKLNENFKKVVDTEAAHAAATAVHGATSDRTASRIVARDSSGGFAAGVIDAVGMKFGYNDITQVNEYQIMVGAHLSVANLFAVGGVATNAYLAQIFGTLGVTSSVTASRFIGEGATPTGSIMLFGGSTPPAGWLLCDGAPVPRSTYADLFDVIEETYGVGDGSTTFNLPNLQGRFPLGANSSTPPGQTGGSFTPNLSTSSYGVTAGADSNVLLSVTGDESPPPLLALNYIIKT